MSNEGKGAGGVGIITVLQIIFIVLKLVGVIDWSWFFVLLPTIISGGFAVFIFLVILIIIIAGNRNE